MTAFITFLTLVQATLGKHRVTNVSKMNTVLHFVCEYEPVFNAVVTFFKDLERIYNYEKVFIFAFGIGYVYVDCCL